MALHVETHTPAFLAAFVSPDPIDITNLDDTPAAAQTGDELVQSWDTVLSGLAGETTYHIVVTAIDGNDHTALREGTFDTAEAPNILVTFHEIHVERDGDDSDVNRGELSFRWGLHELVVGSRGEDKLDDGATVTLDNAHNKHVIQGRRHRIPPAAVRERARARCRRLDRVLQRGRRHQDRLRTRRTTAI